MGVSTDSSAGRGVGRFVGAVTGGGLSTGAVG